VRTALEGQRHEELFRQAASLARPELGIRDEEIEARLLPAFVSVAGERREYEGRRAISDAIARGRVSA
jgi:hypothetical protein